MNKVLTNADLPNALYEAVEREINPNQYGRGASARNRFVGRPV